jgi:hypothetical protein
MIHAQLVGCFAAHSLSTMMATGFPFQALSP